jgi:hypothetical protein
VNYLPFLIDFWVPVRSFDNKNDLGMLMMSCELAPRSTTQLAP